MKNSEFWMNILQHYDDTGLLIAEKARIIGEIFMKYKITSWFSSWPRNSMEYAGSVVYKNSVRVCFRPSGSEDVEDWVLLRSEELALEPEEAERMALDGAWAVALIDDMNFNRKREGVPP